MFLSVDGENMLNADSTHPFLHRDFLLRDGIFETLRIYGGTAFKLHDHIARFRSSALKLRIPFPSDLEAVLRNQIVRAAEGGLRDAIFRVTLTPQSSDSSTLVTMIDALPYLARDWYERGIGVVISTTRRNEFALTAGIKTTSWLVSVAELRAAVVPGAEDTIFLDTMGHVSEASASNIFLVRGETLCTPPISCGALPGITRATVCGLARAIGLKVEDTIPIGPASLESATEFFLTSSVREIIPVVAMNGHAVGPGKPGPWTENITKAYKKVAA